MKLFGFGQSLPSKAKFQEAHFVAQLNSILWKSESVLHSEFVKEGNDPKEKEPHFTAAQKQSETKSYYGHPFTYLVVTSWRILLGYPGSGVVASKAFAMNTVSLYRDENGQNICIAIKNEKSTSYETYIVSDNLANILDKNLSNTIPTPEDQTQFLEYPEDWEAGAKHDGQRLIAQMSKKQSGSDYAIVKQCEACGKRVFSPEIYPPKFFDYCHTCLRKSV